MVDAGVRVSVGGLEPPSSAKSVRGRQGGELLVIDGLLLDGGQHVGGFWVVDVADMDEALAWGRKASRACRAPVEVRPFH